MNRRLLSLTVSIVAISSCGFAQDDMKVDYTDRQYLGNVSYGSMNPVALHYMPITDLADIHVGYRHTGGGFHLIDEAGKANLWEASFSGMKRLGKVTFGGFLVYDNQTLSERRWNNTLFVSQRNPFIIGDSLKSKFNEETFHLEGGAAYHPSEKLLLGLKATYHVGSSATQKDPRPEIKGMRFRLTPGVEYSFGKHGIGVSGEVEWLSEEVTHTVMRTTTKQYVFLFQGLGVYETKDALGYVRKYNGTHWGAQLQYVFNNSADAKISNFLEGGLWSEFEDAIDGSSNIRYKGGRYNGTGFFASDRFQWRATGRSVHNFTLKAAMTDSKGRWYTQKQFVDADGNLTYEVINESDNLESNGMEAAFGYRYDLLALTGLPDLQVEANATLINSETKNKIYGAKETYTNAMVDASVTKRFPIKKGKISASINGQYAMNLDKKLNLTGMPTTYSIIMNNYTRPAYEAATAGYWKAGVELTYSLPMRLLGYSCAMEIRAFGDFANRTESVKGDLNQRYNVGGSFGFIF